MLGFLRRSKGGLGLGEDKSLDFREQSSLRLLLPWLQIYYGNPSVKMGANQYYNVLFIKKRQRV